VATCITAPNRHECAHQNRLEHDEFTSFPTVPGPYSVEFKKDGFETLLRAGITLNSTEVARIDTVLQWAPLAPRLPSPATPRARFGNRIRGHQHEGRSVTDLP